MVKTMAKKPETVTGRWPVAIRDHEGKRVSAGGRATVSRAKADEFDARFGRLEADPAVVPPQAGLSEPGS
ncbi:hypothetical protein [Nitratireductor pacificus]|uniref:hypothetical protein n=1 Tax=Nitratireductor pacificus TaxID=1231180 RepID=UPI0012F70493|nr:hypothetical protein [Nitratireductor pacificus]